MHHGQPLEQEEGVRQVGPGRRLPGGAPGQQAAEEQEIGHVAGAQEQLEQSEERQQVAAGEVVEPPQARTQSGG